MTVTAIQVAHGEAWRSAAVLLAAAVAIMPVVVAGYRMRGTTLVPACLWAALSLLVIAAVEVALGTEPHDTVWSAHLRYLAGITMFGPTMAVLGAKRPQNAAWQFIVLSLLIVLALPSLQALLVGRGDMPTSHAAWQMFLGFLVLLGAFNYLPTRFAVASLLFTTGQVALVADQWPWLEIGKHEAAHLAALVLFAFAAVMAALTPVARGSGEPLDRLFIAFRNAYGAIWGLRVIERVNAAAAQYGWPVRLSWHGFVRADEDAAQQRDTAVISTELRPAIDRVMQGILWRFVSPRWTAALAARPRVVDVVDVSSATRTRR